MLCLEKMNLDKLKRALHPSYLSLCLFFRSWSHFFWSELYNLAVLFTAVYLLQQVFHFHKLRLWLYWTCCVAYRKFMAGAFCTSLNRLNGYTIVISGTESGIGREVARELAARGAHLVLASKDLGKAEDTKRDLDSVKGSVEIRQVDLSSLESVKSFANGIIAHKYHIHMLINIAGELMPPRQSSTDGLEHQMSVNTLGPFLLTNMLLPWLTHHRAAKIINVGASAHIAGDITPGTKPGKISALQAYCDSKLATLLFTKQLAKKMKDTNVEVFCANPGLTWTPLYRHLVPEAVYRCPLWKLFMQTPSEAAQTIVHCALSASRQDGAYYYSECSPGWPSEATEDDSLAERWWREAEDVVGLKDALKQSLN